MKKTKTRAPAKKAAASESESGSSSSSSSSDSDSSSESSSEEESEESEEEEEMNIFNKPREELTPAQRRLKWVKFEKLPQHLQDMIGKKKPKRVEDREKPDVKEPAKP